MPEETPEEMAESIDTYGNRIRSYTASLWRGDINESEFASAMITLVEVGMRNAWLEGMAEAGIMEGEMNQDEIIALAQLISFQWNYIDGYANYIVENSRANGIKLNTLEPRMQMWINRYNESKNQALQMAKTDPKLEWVLGLTEHCADCKKYNGKVKRASYWKKIGARPQLPTLACKGINCECQLVPTDKPLSKGYLTPPSGA